MRTLPFDVRIAGRLLRRAPTFAIASVLTLGLAIGATTAIVSVIDPVLLRPLPYPAPERLVLLYERDRDGTRYGLGFATFRDLVAQSTTIQRAAAIADWQPTLFDAAEGAERVAGEYVSWTYFRTIGIQPALGRDFTGDEDQMGRNQVVILSHGLWQRRYGGDSSLVGRRISIDGTPLMVVGVLPAAFDNVIAPQTEIWRPLGAGDQPWTCRTCHNLQMLVRVQPAVSLAAAATELDEDHRRLQSRYPNEYASPGAIVVPLQRDLTRASRPALVALLGGVLLMLLIAVANVTNLQLARAVRRREEFAIRSALGADRAHLMGQLLTEGCVLAGLGGVLGVVVAASALPALTAHLPQQLPRLSAIHLDLTALGTVIALVIALTLIIGLAPARHPTEPLADDLRGGTRISAGGLHGMRAGLVIVEVALALVLLVSAGLVGQSLVRLLSVNVGFDPTHLLSLEIDAAGPRYAHDGAIYAYHERVREAVRALPGVVSVATVNQLPLGGNFDKYGVLDPANLPPNPELAPNGDRYVASAEYLHTMRIPVVHGRAFTAAEAADTGARVALVSAALAERMWPGEDAIGKRILLGELTDPPYTIIGVAGNVKHEGLDATVTWQWYVPEGQWYGGADHQEMLVLRAQGDPAALTPLVRQTIAAIDPTQPVAHVTTMDQLIAASTAQRRLALALFGAFAIAALALAVAGIYAVIAGSVAERTREMGVRSAFGATPRDIVALVVGQGGRLAVAGIVAGLGVAALLTRYLRSFLFGIGATDPITLASVAALLGAVAVAACIIPALRAARIDPSRALQVK